MNCKSCNKQIDDDSYFCKYCGSDSNPANKLQRPAAASTMQKKPCNNLTRQVVLLLTIALGIAIIAKPNIRIYHIGTRRKG